MVCLGFEPWTAGWKVQMNPLCHGGPQKTKKCLLANRIRYSMICFVAGLTIKNVFTILGKNIFYLFVSRILNLFIFFFF